MRITNVKLNNYVCFYDPEGKGDDVELGSGINFIIGKNNSGKTALLDALTPGVKGRAHRSVATLPERNPIVTPENETTYDIEYNFDEIEIRNFVRQEVQGPPIPILQQFQFQRYSRRTELNMKREAQAIKKYIDGVLADGFSARIHFRADNSEQLRFERIDVSSLGNRSIEVFRVNVDDNSKYSWQGVGPYYLEPSGIRKAWQTITNDIPRWIYRFQAERIAASSSSPNREFNLQPDISNLPQVVKSLKDEETAQFQDFLEHLQTIFPDIHEIVATTSENKVELRIGYYRPSNRRPDLAVSLSECGTGLSQVMAMLYVVVTSEAPRVILIDEPYSFLHPGAVRDLLEIFQEHDHHQYIIATHSPTAIMSVKEKRILLVTRDNMVSTVQGVNVESNADLESMLNTIGTKRSDVFGMDAYIWVEGKTDVTCFNLIMDKHGALPPGVQILELVNVDDLKRSKDASLVEQIYDRLSGGVGILPSALAFIFDGDKRPNDYDEENNSGSRTRYLKRQTFENYFLDFNDIADILSDLINSDDSNPPPHPITPKNVQAWIDEKREKKTFYNGECIYDPETWLDQIHGARFLKTLFKDLAHPTRKYNKVKDGEEITKRILADNPSHFQEIVKLIKCILATDAEREIT